MTILREGARRRRRKFEKGGESLKRDEGGGVVHVREKELKKEKVEQRIAIIRKMHMKHYFQKVANRNYFVNSFSTANSFLSQPFYT